MGMWTRKFKAFEKQSNYLIKKTPLTYWSLQIAFLMTFIIMIAFFHNTIRPLPYDIEGSCNIGFIGVDFQSTFENEAYQYERQLSYYFDGVNGHPRNQNFTSYEREILPKVLNIKNIDGANCQWKIKGEIPQQELKRLLR